MGIPFFIVFVLSIAFLSLGITGLGDFVSVEWPRHDSSLLANRLVLMPKGIFISVEWPQQGSPEAKSGTVVVTRYLSFQANYWAIARCCIGFLLFFLSLYTMGFLLYLEERESGRIMKNVKSFAKLRQFLERHQKGGISQ